MELRRLWQGKSAEVLSSRWDRTRHSAEREVATTWAAIEFMRSGSYVRRGRRCDQLVDANHVAFFNPSQLFRVSHPCGDHNAGTTLRVSKQALTSILSDIDPDADENAEQPFREGIIATTPRCHLLQQRLTDLLTCPGIGKSVRAEETVIYLIRAAALALYRRRRQSSRPRSDHPSVTDRVEAVRRYLSSHWAERVSLAELVSVGKRRNPTVYRDLLAELSMKIASANV